MDQNELLSRLEEMKVPIFLENRDALVSALTTLEPDLRMFELGIKDYARTPVLLTNLLTRLLRTANSSRPSPSSKKVDTPAKAGGDSETTGTTKSGGKEQSVEEIEKMLAEAKAKREAVSKNPEPEPLTLDELEKLLPEAEKAATTFEKSPVWEPDVGDAILIRIKRVIKGGFELPMVIGSEWTEYREGKAGSVQKSELRLPTWAVARAQEKTPPLKFIPDQVYFVKKVGEKDTGKVNPFVQGVVLGPYQDFPKTK